MQKFEDAMVDLAWKNYAHHSNRYKDIETKATGLITIAGVLITFLANLAKSGIYREISLFLLILTSLSFLLTISLSIWVIRVPGAIVIHSEDLINYYKDKEQKDQIYGILEAIAACESSMLDLCEKKAKILSKAVYALGLSVILLIFYSLSTFI
jgi:hypothetical protein